MHKIFLNVWEISRKINGKNGTNTKSLFLFFNILLWCVVGAAVYLICTLLPPVEFSFFNMLVAAGYGGVVVGFFGGAMYVFRNTEPEE